MSTEMTRELLPKLSPTDQPIPPHDFGDTDTSHNLPHFTKPLLPRPANCPKASSDPAGTKVFLDRYVGSDHVLGLDQDNYRDVVDERAVTMVMFYDPDQVVSVWSKKQFAKYGCERYQQEKLPRVSQQEMAPTKKRMFTDGSQVIKVEYLGEHLLDQFFQSNLVVSLTQETFKRFLREKDVVLVMFYDPSMWQSTWSRQQFDRAAKTTQKDNHAYAAVDCTIETELSVQEEVKSLPCFKLYSRGHHMNTVSEFNEFKFINMRKFVESVTVSSPAASPGYSFVDVQADEEVD